MKIGLLSLSFPALSHCAMQALEEKCKPHDSSPACGRIRNQSLHGRLRQVRCARGDQEQRYGYRDLDAQAFERFPVFHGRYGLLAVAHVVTALCIGPTNPGVARRKSRRVSQGEVGRSVIQTIHLQCAEVVQQASGRRTQPQGALERRQRLLPSADGTQHSTEILPVCGDCRLYQGERIEDAHRFLVTPLRAKARAEHIQRTGVKVVRTKYAHAFFLRGCNLAAGQILSR